MIHCLILNVHKWFPDYILIKWDKQDRHFLWPSQISPPILVHKHDHFSVEKWFNVCTVVSSGNFRISKRSGLLFGPNPSSLFIEATVTRLPILFLPPWGLFFNVFCQFYQILIWEKISLGHDRSLAISFLDSKHFWWKYQ